MLLEAHQTEPLEGGERALACNPARHAIDLRRQNCIIKDAAPREQHVPLRHERDPAEQMIERLALSIDAPSQAERWLRIAAAQSPSRADVQENLGVARLLLGRPDVALHLLGVMSKRMRKADEHISGLNSRAVRDPVTGLLNRLAFEERLEEEAARARRYGESFSLILVDLDDLRSINIRYGEPVGDALLTWVGRLLNEHTRASDVPADFPDRDRLYPDPDEWLNEGDSVVVDPLGRLVAGPLHAEHGLLVADIDPAASQSAHYTLDAAGHYNRPDVFSLQVNRAPARQVSFADEPGVPAESDAGRGWSRTRRVRCRVGLASDLGSFLPWARAVRSVRWFWPAKMATACLRPSGRIRRFGFVATSSRIRRSS